MKYKMSTVSEMKKKIDILSPLEYICSFKKSDCVHTTTDKSES